MSPKRFSLLLLLSASLWQSCKKEVDYPADIRPRDFYVRATLVEGDGTERPYEYRGEDTLTLSPLPSLPDLVLEMEYLSNYYIQDSIRYLWGGLGAWDGFVPLPFFIQVSHPNRVTDPFTPPEWRKEDLEEVFFPGKEFRYGGAPGDAVIGIADYLNGAWMFNTLTSDNSDSYLRVLEVSDYGIPELGTPYFGKKVRFQFSCRLSNGDSGDWRLRDGEAVLFFRYYQF